jgi:5-methylcytosine-specific restriction endonuclease McrA
VCGTETEKDADTARRSVCSALCRRFLQFGDWPACAIPDTHPIVSTRIPDGHPARRTPRPYLPVFQPAQRPCGWCGEEFTAYRTDARFCRTRCKNAAKARMYRARQHNAPGTFTLAEVMHIYLAFGKTCAYCRQPIDGLPEPEHVVPLSRGGSNSITNILPSCSPCNSDKRDLFLHEWAQDRERRNLPPRITQWERGDPLYQHLTIVQEHERVA